MNVLILTPDAVGSTLLQRFLTITMQFHDYDRPVINLHELTNGIMRYYSPDFRREVLGRHPDRWGYHQSLPEITELLHTTDHYKTSRLAHYHIRNRRDSLEYQLPFYRYLNENFFVIACERRNLFEHAMSWAITRISRRLNVYSAQEKISSFLDLYRDGVQVDPRVMVQALDDYRSYLQWCRDHFSISSYFVYERDVANIETYVAGLPIFPAGKVARSWQDVYGISFDDWNRYRYFMSDVGSVALAANTAPALEHIAQADASPHDSSEAWTTPPGLIADYQKVRDDSWPEVSTLQQYENLPQRIRQECSEVHGIEWHLDQIHLVRNLSRHLPQQHQLFLQQHHAQYDAVCRSIEQMCQLGIMLNAPPIKKQTLREKMHMVRNFDQCLDQYNAWCAVNDVAAGLDRTQLQDQLSQEQQYWFGAAMPTARLID